jgi:peptidyl-prolyl cis-trans isomerase D
MFDLFRSREKYTRYILGALLVIVALSMVITLVPGYGSGGGNADAVLAKIGGDDLTLQEASVNLQAAMKQGRIPPEVAEMYVPLYVNKMIAERALAYQAKRMGLQVTDEEVARTIQTMIPQLFQDGRLANRDAYAQMLAEQNMTIPQFEDNLRKQLLLTKLQDLVLEGAVVSPSEAESEYHKENDKVKISFVALSPDKLKGQVTATPEEIKDYFNKNRTAFQIDEKRAVKVLALDEETVASGLNVTDAELRQAYNSNLDRYRTPERVKVRHILLKTVGKPKEEWPKIKARAEELLKQIKGGADFAELAKKNSEDPSSAVNGGAMDWITKGQTVPNFEKTAFSLKPKEISPVIETEYGYHIVQLLEKEDARLKPFEEVKSELATEARKQVLFDKLQNPVDQARDAVTKTPGQVDAIAQKFGMKEANGDKIGRFDPVPEIGVNQELTEAIFSLPVNGVTPVVQAAGNKLAFAVVTGITPARPAELSEVEGKVRDAVVSQKTQKLFADKVAQATAKSKEVNGDLARLAKEIGAEVKNPEAFNRAATVPDLGGASYLNQAFDSPPGTILGPIQMPGQTAFVKVLEKIPADSAGLASSRDTIVQRLKSQKARQRQELLEDSIVTQLTRDGKIKINKDAMSRLVANYKRG